MNKPCLLIITFMCFFGSTYSQTIKMENVATEILKDSWRYFNGNSFATSIFVKPKYSRDKKVYFEENNNRIILKRAPHDLENGLLAFTYNPYPFVNIVIPDKGVLTICYLPISDIEYIIGLIQKTTGLVYDPDSPETFPTEGRYELSSPSKLEIDSTGESYYLSLIHI